MVSSITFGMLLRALPLALLLAPLAASCLANVEDAGDDTSAADDPITAISQQEMKACSDDCAAIASGDCQWSDECDGSTFPIVWCRDRYLQCDWARHAGSGEPAGLVYCYRECMHLK